MIEINKIYQGNALDILKTFPDECIDCCITSPPYYGLRSYEVEPIIWDAQDGVAWHGMLGLEPTYQLYISHLIQIFKEVHRVLKKTGTCFVNISDSYGGSGGPGTWVDNKQTEAFKRDFKKYINPNRYAVAKSLIQIPERFSIAMTDAGWIKRNTIIWHKPNCMPSSANDRFTVDHEYVYFFVKNKKYYFKQLREPHKEVSLKRVKAEWNGHREPLSSYYNMDIKRMCHPEGRNRRTVWSINTSPSAEPHFATFPPALVEPMIQAGCPRGGIVLDPFSGIGTSCRQAKAMDRQYIGIELSEKYAKRSEVLLAMTDYQYELEFDKGGSE